MEFDIRKYNYVVKHILSPQPEIDAERFKEHFHPTYELLYFMHGDADFSCQHTLYHNIEGSLLLARPGEYHNIIFHSQAPYERYVIRFSPFDLYPYVRKKLEKAQHVYHIRGTPIEQLFMELDKHLQLVHPDVRLAVCIGFIQILVAHLISSDDLIIKADYINLEAKRIVDYVDEHLPDIHSVNDLVTALHMSKSSVHKIFSQQLGTSIMNYVRTQKCIQARNLLHSGIPATQVCEQLGFNHYSSFYRDYRYIFHENPSETEKLLY